MQGKDITVVGIAFMVRQALQAAEQLAKEGVSVEVIDPRTLAPLDIDYNPGFGAQNRAAAGGG